MSDLENPANPNTLGLSSERHACVHRPLGSQVEFRRAFSCSSRITGRFFSPQVFLKYNQIKANLRFSSFFSPQIPDWILFGATDDDTFGLFPRMRKVLTELQSSLM